MFKVALAFKVTLVYGIPQSFQNISIFFCFNNICRLAEDWGYNPSGKFFEIYYNLTNCVD